MKILPTTIGLRSAVVMLVLVPLLATFTLGSYFLLATLENKLEARLQEEIALIARTLRVPLARAVERDRERSLDRALRSTYEFGRVYGVYVYDDNGDMIARADNAAEPETTSLNNLDIAREKTTGEYGSMEGREVYSYFTPLTGAGGQVIGMLQVTRRASEIRDYIESIRYSALLVLIAFSIPFVLIITLGHHVAIGRPLRALAGTMERVKAGDTDARAALSGPHEIRWLSARFNKMLEGMSQRDAALAVERRRQTRLQAQLRASEKYALVGRLATGVAHELGTPLTVIDGHAQRRLRNTSADAEERSTLLRIREAAARMADIVQQLLGFGRESTRQSGPVPLHRLIALAAADTHASFEQFDVALEIAHRSDDVIVHVDEYRMREALAHLLKNAAHASRGGRVRIGGMCTQQRTGILIEDSGKGIATRDRERVFDPFYTTKPPGEGSGLGLAIVRGIIADHGANISVHESPLGGAAFHVEFESARSSE